MTAVWARARDRALRRLAAEHVATYRQVKAQRLAAIPRAVPRQRAQRRAVSQALSELAKRYPERYRELYEWELEKARSEPLLIRRGRPPGVPDQLSLSSESLAMTWRRAGPPRSRPGPITEGARRRAEREAVRQRAAELFAKGRSATSVADELDVARQTAVEWQARWRSGGGAALRSRGPSRRPAVPDGQLPAIEDALLKGAGVHGFDGDVWTSARIAVVIQRVTGVQLGSKAVQRLLRERLGWSFQPLARRRRHPKAAGAARTAAPAGQDAAQAGSNRRPHPTSGK